jgi:hypothetical protein
VEAYLHFIFAACSVATFIGLVVHRSCDLKKILRTLTFYGPEMKRFCSIHSFLRRYLCDFFHSSSLTFHGMKSHSAVKGKSKTIPVTGREGPQGCETSRFPHFLYNQLTDGGGVSLTRRPPFTPQEDSCFLFLLEANSNPKAIVRLGGLGQLKNPMTSSGFEPVTSQLVA